MQKIRERKEIDPAFTWDLTTLYADDASWEREFAKLEGAEEKAASYEGTLSSADAVLSFLEWDTELGRRLSDLFVYASLRHSEDTRASDAQGMYARIYSRYVKIAAASAFAEPEILSLEEDALVSLAADPKLAGYRFYLEKLIRSKPHMLSAREEVLLSSFGEAFGVAKQVADALRDADLVFEDAVDSEGERHPVTESAYIPLEMSADRKLRESAFHSYYKTYRQHIHTFAAAYSGTLKTSAAEAQVRGYGSAREMSLAGNHIPLSVYDNLITSVRSRMDLMYRYLKLRKRILKTEELHYYDVYAPLSSGSSASYTYEQAQQMVLDAVSPLGEAYVSRVRQAYKERWIDVYPNAGKSSGAYSSGTYDSNPFILTNFSGTLDSVSTLAHEMGHSQHTWLTNHTQPPQYGDYSLFVAEVASTVNENLLIEQLLADTTEPHERLALLNQYLEGFKGTVYRQTMFAEFEKEAHGMAERGESCDAESLSALYERLIRDYFGDTLVMDEEIKYEWARIPHFYRPFYVYVYATGYTSAAALSEAILKEGDSAVERYLEFLSLGGSMDPLDELRHAGVDLKTPEPIDRALDKFETVLEDAEKTADALGL